MKTSQIKKLLKGVYDNFCETITDDNIKKIIKEKTFITGGSIPSMILDEFVNDFDFYFQNKEDAEKVKAYFSVKQLNIQTNKFKVNLITDNAVNLSDKVQLVIKFNGSPDEVVKNFDWQHIKSYFIYPDTLVIPDDTYRLLVEKELVYTGSEYPLSSLMRVKKYIKKGWSVSNQTIVNIALDFHMAMTKSEKERAFLTAPIRETVSVEDIIYHLNGVDPIIIQDKLQKQAGEYLTIKEIIKLIQR